MEKNSVTVRELTQKDTPLIADYWLTNNTDYLRGLGVDVAKLPSRKDFTAMLQSQLALPYNEKKSYALIWESDGKPIGHSNVNPILFGDHGYMHLHIWEPENRKKGFGVELIRLSLPYYFINLKLKKVYCEPYALNPAPNALLQKAGFTFIKKYVTTPGTITFLQAVKLWEITI